MNEWKCCESGCGTKVRGEGGAIGLRAIGWYFAAGGSPEAYELRASGKIPRDGGPAIFCPAHRPDGIPCKQERMDGEPEPPERCSQCMAEQQALRLQQLISLAEAAEPGERVVVRIDPLGWPCMAPAPQCDG